MRPNVMTIDLQRVDLVVDAAPATPMDLLVRGLARQVHGTGAASAPPPVVYLDGRPIDQRATVRQSGIRDGAVLSLGDPAAGPSTSPPAAFELQVTSAPRAGESHPLRPTGRARRAPVGDRLWARVRCRDGQRDNLDHLEIRQG